MKKKLLSRIGNLDLTISMLAMSVLIGVTFLGVIWRYFMNRPFIWQEEVQVGLIVWVVCFGGSAAFRKGGHVAIDMIVGLLPPGLQKVLTVAAHAFILLALGYLFVTSYSYVAQMAAKNRVTYILKIPYAAIYGVLPLNCILMCIGATIAVWSKGGTPPEVRMGEADEEGAL